MSKREILENLETGVLHFLSENEIDNYQRLFQLKKNLEVITTIIQNYGFNYFNYGDLINLEMDLDIMKGYMDNHGLTWLDIKEENNRRSLD
jgi:hypothetical protein